MMNFVKRLRNVKTQASWLTVCAAIHFGVVGDWLIFVAPGLLVVHSFLQDYAARRPPYRHGQ
jgi:hypothetical protein